MWTVGAPGPTSLALTAALVALGVAVAAGGWWALRRRLRPRRQGAAGLAAAGGEQPARPRLTVVANPTKLVDVTTTRDWVAGHAERLGWAAPRWRFTSADDPGHGPALAALAEDGAEAVVVFGGDGTVRAVGGALAGTGVPLGILPAGTGNLLARNLAIPVTDLEQAITLALSGPQRRIDVGTVEIDVSGEDQRPRRESFLVMAGLGFDAEVMASVEPALKERVGWWAYVVAGARRLRGRRTRVTLRLDDRESELRHVRSVVIGNCGELTAGLRLMPAASVDDGWLDVVVVAPRRVLGWAAVVGTVMTRGRIPHPVIRHHRCRRIEVRAERPLHVQLDGDPAGLARVLRAELQPSALLVRARH